MVGVAGQSRGRGGHIARLVDHEDVVGGVGRQLGALPAYGSRRSRSRSSRRRRTGCAVVGRRGILVPAGLRCGCGRQCVVCPRRKAAVATSQLYQVARRPRNSANPPFSLLRVVIAARYCPVVAAEYGSQTRGTISSCAEHGRSQVVVWEGDVAAGSINVQVVKDEN